MDRGSRNVLKRTKNKRTPGTSEDKRACLINLPSQVVRQASAEANLRYALKAFTVFAVTDPMLREIFPPAFADRLVQQRLIGHKEPG